MQFSELSCTGPDYCPNQVCCAHFTVIGMGPTAYRHYTSVACQAACPNDGTQTVICDPNAANPCPFGGQCTPSQLLGNPYNICG
jgi:hypothetical protein